MKNIFYLFQTGILFLFSLSLPAQDMRLYMPREIRQAYENGTRSYDGRPGKNYWHNTADYTLDVTVHPDTRALDGSGKVVYHNNSPEELKTLVLRLYQDAFRNGNVRDYDVGPNDINSGTVIRKLAINGEAYDMENTQKVSRQGTNLVVQLSAPLMPGGKLDVEIDWSIAIPEANIRMGMYDSTTFFIAYFYPQVAVYDDIFGWDRLSYTLRTEFYNNLGNFDVTIHAPESFTIWSTGILENAKEVYPAEIYKRYEQAQGALETVHVLTAEELFAENGYKNLSGTWHYVAKDVSDFAFGISDHFAWDAVSQDVSGRKVLVSTAFPADKAKRFAEVTAITQKAMKHMSVDAPGIAYPYPRFTTFIGSDGGGMEYPMMACNAGPSMGVTIHELFHTYFPMYVRTNEKRWAWMDEGWADYITDWVIDRYFEGNEDPIFNNFTNGIQAMQGSFSDLPLITSSQFTDNSNYGYTAYPLPAYIYGVLHHHLGDELFLKCYREYINRWAQKSPTPYDFFFTFENVSGQDLAWLWKPWFFEFGYPDVAIESYKKGKLVVRNKGNRPAPLTLKIVYADGKEESMIQPASVWKSAGTYEFSVPDYKNAKSLVVNEQVADINELDNYHPSPKELYQKLSLASDLTGAYKVVEYPVELTISQKNGMLFLSLPAAGLATYLVPMTGSISFETLDGGAKIHFLQTDGKTVSLEMEAMGESVTANKN
ncbi:MAG: M1 family metallopeptidase [Saprospirales bacterium]|nr:M1 family metallopeptidase [Saprospirales bacterium]